MTPKHSDGTAVPVPAASPAASSPLLPPALQRRVHHAAMVKRFGRKITVGTASLLVMAGAGIDASNTLLMVVVSNVVGALGYLAHGWAGDRFGTKRVFVSALGIFVLGSVLAGLAWNIESLIGRADAAMYEEKRGAREKKQPE